MSDYEKTDPTTRDLTPVRDGERHRRSSSAGSSPFSRVSGSLRAADTTPVQGLPREDRSESRVRPVFADNEPLESVRRPVQAEGYSERRHAQTDRTLYDEAQSPYQRKPALAHQPRDTHPQAEPGGSDGHKPVRRGPQKKRQTPLIIALVVLVLAMAVLFFLIDPLHLLHKKGASADGSGESVQTLSRYELWSEDQQDGSVVVRLITEGDIDAVDLLCDGRLIAWSSAATDVGQSDGTRTADKEWSFTITEPFKGTVEAILIKNDVRDTRAVKSLSLAVAGVSREPAATPGSGQEDLVAVQTPVVSRSAGEQLSCDISEGAAPLTVTFTVTADQDASEVRLVRSNGDVLDCEAIRDTDDESTWTMSYTFEDDEDTYISAQGFYDGTWIDIGESVPIFVSATYADPEDELLYEEEYLETVTGDAQDEPAQTPVPISNVQIVTASTDQESTENTVRTDGTQAVTVTIAPTNAPPIVTQVPLDQNGATPTPVPPATPEPEVTPEPEAATPEPVATAEPVTAEKPAEARRIGMQADKSASPDQIKTVKIFNEKKRLNTYVRGADDELDLGDADHYMPRAYGVLTFRSSSFRQNAASGTIGAGELTGMTQVWQVTAGSAKGTGKTVYYGIGKGSQPAIVQWSSDVRSRSNIVGDKRDKKALKEVIAAGDDGRIYFLDLEDGVATRSPVNLGVPMRGTPSVHAYGQPYMVVGQYARKMANRTYKIGLRAFNLLTQKEMSLLDGLESGYKNPYRTIAKNSSIIGSFNTSALYDYHSDTMLAAGSNGLLYVSKLNAATDMNANTFSLKPATVVFASQASGEKAANVAVESSMAGYQNYVFYADKAGWLRSVDVNSLTVGWAVNTGDTVEAAVALDLDEEENLWLYTANSLQLRKKGDAQIRRYNAETGKEDWVLSVPVVKPKKDAYIAGVIASPVIGTQGLGDYVYFTVSGLSADGGDKLLGKSEAVPAALVCIEKATGKVRWAYALESYSYSSPVAVYNEDGQGWIIQGESNGTMHILDGVSGTLVQSVTLEGAINGSPAVYRRMLVVGTQGKNSSYIYGFELNHAE